MSVSASIVAGGRLSCSGHAQWQELRELLEDPSNVSQAAFRSVHDALFEHSDAADHVKECPVGAIALHMGKMAFLDDDVAFYMQLAQGMPWGYMPLEIGKAFGISVVRILLSGWNLFGVMHE
eukprot:TRINITY_DN26406_c0_g1_i5.p1 TRINITY_DN26406_c0_g1~~TRINITY_DN26406_c0_g1_i5.p1  ORF type:complete len:122 (-),score=22.38 TRINITY_DN26406_c0_g1_i5:238-603(-)